MATLGTRIDRMVSYRFRKLGIGEEGWKDPLTAIALSRAVRLSLKASTLTAKRKRNRSAGNGARQRSSTPRDRRHYLCE
jgi:hypothetical protein